MNEQELIWKDIPNTFGKYSVTQTGLLRNNNYRKTGKVKIVCPSIYGSVVNEKFISYDTTDENGQYTHATRLLSELIYETFIGPLNGGRVIPKDGDWLNVSLDNIEIVPYETWLFERKKIKNAKKSERKEKIGQEEISEELVQTQVESNPEPEKESYLHEGDINSLASTLEEFIRNKILCKLQLSEFRCSITFQEGTMDVEEIKFTRKQ